MLRTSTRILTLSLVVVLMLSLAGLALADNEAYVQQVGPGPGTHALALGVGIQIIQVGDGNIVTGTGSVGADLPNLVLVGQPAALQDGSPAAGNDLRVIQTGGLNTLSLDQRAAAEYNLADILSRDGGNLVVGATADFTDLAEFPAAVAAGPPYDGVPAIQGDIDLPLGNSVHNFLRVSQAGGGNEVGLHQDSNTNNEADFDQTGGDNVAAVYQQTTFAGGSNYADITQDSGAGVGQLCSVAQSNAAADNITVISQTP